MKISFLFLFLALPLVSHSEVPEECTDLARFACSPGEQHDGTGAAATRMFSEDMVEPETTKEVKEKLRQGFSKLLKDENNAYFRDLAISGMGLRPSPDCKSNQRDAIERCNKNLVQGLVTFGRGRLLERTDESDSSAQAPVVYNLEERALLLKNIKFSKVLSDVNESVNKKFVNSANEKKIREKVFPKTRDLLVARIARLDIDEKKKAFMLKKVKAIEFEGTDCTEYQNNLSRHFYPNAYYRPQSNSLKICKGLLKDDVSEFHIAGILAHELAHAVDPCGLMTGPDSEVITHKNTADLAMMDSEYPIPALVSCLRSEKSVAAKNKVQQLNLSQIQMQTQLQMQQTSIPSYGGGVGIQLGYGFQSVKFNHCDGDQIGESTSDWFAAEVVGEYIEQAHPELTSDQWRVGVSNIFRPFCSNVGDRSKFDEHPDAYMRINAIVLTNPKLRAKMKCPPAHPKLVYCDGKTVPASVTPSGAVPSANPPAHPGVAQ